MQSNTLNQSEATAVHPKTAFVQNGRPLQAKGEEPPANQSVDKWVHIFPNGARVRYQPVSRTMMSDARSMLEPKAPKPRLEEVSIAGRTMIEEQDQAPDYLRKVQFFSNDVGTLFSRMITEFGAVEIFGVDWQSEVKKYRKKLSDMGEGIVTEPNDKILYVQRIASAEQEAFEYTFSTGVTVKGYKVSNTLSFDAHSSLEASKPSYDEPLMAYINWMNLAGELYQRMVIELAVTEISTPDWDLEAKAYRDRMQQFGTAATLSTSDKALYISRMAAGTSNELSDFIKAAESSLEPMTEFLEAVQKVSVPTEAAIQESVAEFRPS